jgi:putative membrane protein
MAPRLRLTTFWSGAVATATPSNPWLFHTIERIGRVGENPFEASANDVPISTICRGIEIDLREQLGEDPEMIPKQIPEAFDIQM